jgi:hypothetical protein
LRLTATAPAGELADSKQLMNTPADPWVIPDDFASAKSANGLKINDPEKCRKTCQKSSKPGLTL